MFKIVWVFLSKFLLGRFFVDFLRLWRGCGSVERSVVVKKGVEVTLAKVGRESVEKKDNKIKRKRNKKNKGGVCILYLGAPCRHPQHGQGRRI